MSANVTAVQKRVTFEAALYIYSSDSETVS